MVSSSSPYDWLSIDHYCWYSFLQYYDSICQWKLNCCQTFPTKLTAQHSERASFVTQANKSSSKYSSVLPICGRVPEDLFLTFAISDKRFPVLSEKKIYEAIFNAFNVFSYILWKITYANSHSIIQAICKGRCIYWQQNGWQCCAEREESHMDVTRPARVYKYLLKFIFQGPGRNHIMKKKKRKTKPKNPNQTNQPTQKNP